MGSFRPASLVFCCVLAHRVISAKTPGRRLQLAWLTGVACFLAQLGTPEVGIFGFMTAISVVVLYTLKRRALSEGGALALVLGGSFAVCNLLLSTAYRLTSPQYESLFTYQRYALSMMSGYHNGMGLGWTVAPGLTAALLLVAAWTFVSAAYAFATRPIEKAALFVSLTIGSLLSLTNALTRSEIGHVFFGFTPFIFTFLIAGLDSFRGREGVSTVGRLLPPMTWLVVYITLMAAWPDLTLAAFNDFRKSFSPSLPPWQLWNQLRSRDVPPSDVLPADLIEDAGRSSVPMLAFPYHNYIPIVLGRPLVAPVLQNYSTGTELLQDFYVRELARRQTTGLDVVYAVDGISAWAVDTVQAITRTPAVFEYLYRNYELANHEPRESGASGLFMLRRLAQARSTHMTDIPFQASSSDPHSLNIRLAQPATCGVVQLEVRMDYPISRLIRRPNFALVMFERNHKLIEQSYLRPIAIGSFFTTDFSIVRPWDFYQLFSNDPVPTSDWDEIQINIEQTDWMGVDPSGIDVRAVRCLDPDRFVRDERPTGLMEESFKALPTDTESKTLAGYVQVQSTTGATPQLFARFGFNDAVPIIGDWTRGTLVQSASINLRGGTANTGIAIANPNSADNVIDLDLKGPGGVVAHREIRLRGGEHLSKRLEELFSFGDDKTLELHGRLPFAAACVELRYGRIHVMPAIGTPVDDPGLAVFPQFAMYGRWGTELLLTNHSKEKAEGRIRLLSAKDQPLTVKSNGVAASEFNYSLGPGESMKLSPDGTP
jgi:hypothetical protein